MCEGKVFYHVTNFSILFRYCDKENYTPKHYRMKNLIEISKIVTKKRVKKIEIFDEHSLRNKSSKFNEFYEDLSNNKYRNDRDAATKLYQCSPKDARYRQLKSRFRKRLLNTLFFLDVNKPSASNFERAHFTCHKEWTLVKILQDNDAHNSAQALARSILTTALKFQISEIIVNVARILREYAAGSGDQKDYENYDNLVKSYSDIMGAEVRAEELYQRVVMEYYRPLAEDSDLPQRIASYSNTLLSLSEMYQSPIIFYNMFLVWAMNYEINREYPALLEVCERAENYINDHPDYYQEERLIAFFTKKMSAYLHLEDYLHGRVNAENCLKRFPEGSNPWFNFMEYYLLLALHTDRYIQAMAIFNRTTEQKSFAKLSPAIREKWFLFEAVLQFVLLGSPFADKIASLKKRGNFNATEFLQKEVNFTAQKKVLNFHYLSLKCGFLLHKRPLQQTDLLDQIIDELQRLANRSLSKIEHRRPINFIRLMLQLRKADYQVDELRNTEKYLTRLSDNPFTYRGVLSQFEPIPVEKLWQLIIDKLS